MSAVPQAELHRHLDVCTRISTLLEWAQADGLEAQSTSLAAFQNKIWLTEPLTSLEAVLGTFKLFQQVLSRPERLVRLAFEAAEDCAREGTSYVEFRYSPAFVAEYGRISWSDILFAFEQGLARARAMYPQLKTPLICISSREYGPDEAARTVEFALENKKSFVGIDLAGGTGDFSCRRFGQAFAPAVAQGMAVTVHAGESDGPESIWEAIEILGARRIGHGVSSVRDEELMRTLQSRGICLEMCPTSNWITRAVPSIEEHPLRQVIEAGIPVCINTDDPGVFPVTLGQEYELARTTLGLSQEQLEWCRKSAWDSKFID